MVMTGIVKESVSGPVLAKNMEIDEGIDETIGENDQDIKTSPPTTATVDRLGEVTMNAPIEVPPEQAAEMDAKRAKRAGSSITFIFKLFWVRSFVGVCRETLALVKGFVHIILKYLQMRSS